MLTNSSLSSINYSRHNSNIKNHNVFFQTEISNRIAALEAQVVVRDGPSFNGTGNNPHNPLRPSMKLDLPHSDGSNPVSWIFKINQYFDFHRTPDDQRVRLASFSMEGEALTWY